MRGRLYTHAAERIQNRQTILFGWGLGQVWDSKPNGFQSILHMVRPINKPKTDYLQEIKSSFLLKKINNYKGNYRRNCDN